NQKDGDTNETHCVQGLRPHTKLIHHPGNGKERGDGDQHSTNVHGSNQSLCLAHDKQTHERSPENQVHDEGERQNLGEAEHVRRLRVGKEPLAEFNECRHRYDCQKTNGAQQGKRNPVLKKIVCKCSCEAKCTWINESKGKGSTCVERFE